MAPSMHRQLYGSIGQQWLTTQAPVPDRWTCRLCGQHNVVVEEADDDKPESEAGNGCTRCGRQQYPSWLCIQPDSVQLDLGARVVMRSEDTASPIVGVVAGLDYYTQQVELITIALRASYRTTGHTEGQREVASAGGRRSKYRFELLTLNATQLQSQLTTSEPQTSEVEELVSVLRQQGVCGDCRRLFRIAHGDSGREEQSREAITSKQAEMERCKTLKAQCIGLKEFNKALECTSTLRSLAQELLLLKRKVEFLNSVTCPHCEWEQKPVPGH